MQSVKQKRNWCKEGVKVLLIMDAENTFFYKKALTGTSVTSDVVMNGNGGDAGVNELYLQAKLHTAVSSAATLTLLTSDTENMASPVTLATQPIATTTKKLALRLPKGCKKYLQVTVTAGTALTIW